MNTELREIKFRALELDSPVGINWVYGYYVEEDGYWMSDNVPDYDQPCTRYYIIDRSGKRFDICPDTKGQSVGSKDKNGKEFFEGDIVVHKSSDYYIKGVIEYDSENSTFVVSSKRGKFKLGIIPDQFEIIGNIHEIPELMERDEP